MMVDEWRTLFGTNRWRRDGRSGVFTAAIAVAMAVVWSVGIPAGRAADNDKLASVKVVVADAVVARIKAQVAAEDVAPSEAEKRERARLREITREAARRVKKRLSVAEVKQYNVDTQLPRTLQVTTRGDVSHRLLAGIVVPAGQFKLRAVVAAGHKWTDVSGRLPAGVEIRQPDGSVEAGAAFLWSRSRATLRQAIAAVDFEGLDIVTYPAGGGWRTLVAGETVATEDDVGRVKMRHGYTGEVYVQINFTHAVAKAAGSRRSGRTRWAVMLDGEVVASLQRMDATLGDSLTVGAPAHLGSQPARQKWAQQVAARLSAPIGVALLEVPDL